MRARRVIVAASVAALGVLSLAACGRSAPSVAAYVGDTTYSVDRVDTLFAEAQATYEENARAAFRQENGPSASPSPELLRIKATRQDMLNLLVGLDLAKRIVAEKNIPVQDQIKADQLGQSLKVPGSEYAKLAAEWYNHFVALQTGLPTAELTDSERSKLYDALVEADIASPGWSVEQQRAQFAAPEIAQQATAVVALSTAFKEEVEREDVTVNPRYSSLEIPALFQVPNQGLGLYNLPYLDRTSTVTDVSTPEPLPSSEAPSAEAPDPGTAS
ncbi:hypothetical protein O7634_14265 [Micromonospora sp. WMMD1120]|uniref:hypothetical protein n=1 Tax=Micromonospora sp. WMMD1120 TaxID=3016106 RepID=UPI002416DB12|nr:hypothetical protein [Micromonospora sp. WMMD1120]MDG4807917.1 hypothetical protein [Micromonospora sp. WMMD1120]